MDLMTRITNLITFAMTLALQEVLRESAAQGKEPVQLLEDAIKQTGDNDKLAAALIEKYQTEIATKKPVAFVDDREGAAGNPL